MNIEDFEKHVAIKLKENGLGKYVGYFDLAINEKQTEWNFKNKKSPPYTNLESHETFLENMEKDCRSIIETEFRIYIER